MRGQLARNSLQGETAGAAHDASAVNRPRGSWHSLLIAVVGGCLVGIAAGYLVGLSEASPPTPGTTWAYRVPELPKEAEALYRTLFGEAREMVSDAMEAHPDSSQAVSGLALLNYLAHDTLSEIACWERCLELDRTNWLARSRLIALAQQQTDYRRIVELMQQILPTDPNYAKYRSALGSALMYLNRHEEASQVLEELVRSGSGTSETFLVMGEVCNQRGQPRRAKRFLETSLALDPRRIDASYSLAKVCAKLGETEQAAAYRKHFTKLKAEQRRVDTSRDNPREGMRDESFLPVRICEIMTYAGKAYTEKGDFERGERCLLRASEISPQDRLSRQLLSELANHQGRYQEALRWTEELKKLEPQNHLHLRNVGLLYIQMQKLDEAEQVFQELCRVEPTRAFGYAALAELSLRRNRQLSAARAWAQRAVALEPTGRNCCLLAAIAEKTGDLAAARAALERALASEPNNPEYQRLYASISKPK